MTTSSINTLELPRHFTHRPEAVIVETRLTRLAARQRAAIVRDCVAAAVFAGFAMICALGLAGF